jgi:hypothetical protein
MTSGVNSGIVTGATSGGGISDGRDRAAAEEDGV